LASLSFSEIAPAYSARYFSGICTSQGSVAMRFRCGGILNDYFIGNFPDSVPVKKF